jgi:predicted anti-sigma-YlaC factor YlaD
MLRHDCAQLPDIVEATVAGRALNAPLAAHLASCPSCREQVEAAAFVRRLADTPDAPHPLPDPAVIWWKAQLLRRWQAERSASAPIERMHWIELAAGLASLAAFLAWQWKTLASALAQVIPMSLASMTATPAPGHPLSSVLLIGGAASVAIMFLAALHRRLGGTSR